MIVHVRQDLEQQHKYRLAALNMASQKSFEHPDDNYRLADTSANQTRANLYLRRRTLTARQESSKQFKKQTALLKQFNLFGGQVEQIDPRVMKSLQESESCRAGMSNKKNQLTLVELQSQRGSKTNQFRAHGQPKIESNSKSYSINSQAYKDGTPSGSGGIVSRRRPRLMSARVGGGQRQNRGTIAGSAISAKTSNGFAAHHRKRGTGQPLQQ